MIDMNKQYKTRCGYPVRVLCTDRPNSEYSVVALVELEPSVTSVEQYTPIGEFWLNEPGHDLDLVEVTPWDYPIDHPVYVQQSATDCWRKGHFAGIKNGAPTTWANGATSWSKRHDDDRVTWAFCREA